MLSNTWLTDITTDFEYKKYILLAYLQKVSNYFDEVKIYPHLVEINKHYNSLVTFKTKQSALLDSFPKKIKSIDLKKKEIIYEQTVFSDSLGAIDEMVDYSIPKFEKLISEGEEIEVLVKENTSMEPVGIVPIYQKEGYLFLKRENEPKIFVYEYQQSNIIFPQHSLSTIVTTHITTENDSYSSVISLKNNIVKRVTKLPNPATYFFYSTLSFPVEETLLPEAKRRLLEILA